MERQADATVLAYLAFLEREVPQHIVAVSNAEIMRAVELTKNVVVSDADVIPSDVSI